MQSLFFIHTFFYFVIFNWAKLDKLECLSQGPPAGLYSLM